MSLEGSERSKHATSRVPDRVSHRGPAAECESTAQCSAGLVCDTAVGVCVECLTDAGTDGPIEVWGQDEYGGWFMVKREIAVGISERD